MISMMKASGGRVWHIVPNALDIGGGTDKAYYQPARCGYVPARARRGGWMSSYTETEWAQRVKAGVRSIATCQRCASMGYL